VLHTDVGRLVYQTCGRRDYLNEGQYTFTMHGRYTDRTDSVSLINYSPQCCVCSAIPIEKVDFVYNYTVSLDKYILITQRCTCDIACIVLY